MADTKASALSAVASVAATDQFINVPAGGQSSKATASQIRQYVGAGLSNASTIAVAGGYAADTYLAGSSITIPVAGGWKAGTQYSCVFDMTKTAAGTAAFTIILRMGTLGTTGDAAIATATYTGGTAGADIGWFQFWATFRTVGSGTSAVVQTMTMGLHNLAAGSGLFANQSGSPLLNTSAGFNSTTQTIIGLSVNGGASFSGTNTIVQAFALNI